MKALKAGSQAALRRAGSRWTHARMLRAMLAVLRAKGDLSLQQLADHMGVSPRHIVELTHWVLGPDPALGLQGAEFTPVFKQGPQGMRVQAGAGLGRALERLATISANEAGLALAGLRQLQSHGAAPRRQALKALADRLAYSEAGEAAGHDGALAQPLPILELRAVIERSIAERRSLRFDYRGSRGTQARHARPRCVFSWAENGDELYLEAWDEGANAVRHFRLSLMLPGSLQLGPLTRAFNASEVAAFTQGRMDSPFEQAFEPVLVLATGDAAQRLAEGELRAKPWSGPQALPPKGWRAFELRYKDPAALVRALRAMIPEATVAAPLAFADAWKREVAAIKKSVEF